MVWFQPLRSSACTTNERSHCSRSIPLTGSSTASRCADNPTEREVFIRQLVALGEEHRPFHRVSQLAHVARPAIRLQTGHRGGRDVRDALTEFGVVEVDVEIDELWDVAGPLTQRGKGDRHDVEAIIQIGAEPPLLDLVLEIAIRGGNDADIHMDVRGAADPLECLLFQKPQQLGLQQRHHLADFVEKDRAAVRRFNQAPFWRSAPVNAPRSCPNSSLSSSVSGSAEHVMFMNGLLARGLA